MRYFIIGALLTTAALVVSGAIAVPVAQAINPSDVPPWGTGPAPVANPPGSPPVDPSTRVSTPVIQQPPTPTIVVPTGSDKFTLFKSDGSSTDVTGSVFLFLDQKTGSQYIIYMMPTPVGLQTMMVKR